MKNKKLLIIFIILLAIVLIFIPQKNKKSSSTFKSQLTDFDTALVTEIQIQKNDDIVTFIQNDNKWKVKSNDQSFNADKAQINQMLSVLMQLKAKKLVANSKDRWANYELSDSSAIKVTVNAGKKELAMVYIGKFDYKQPSQPANPYMQQQQGSMTSYVRVEEDKEVYAVDGFLQMSFGRNIAEYRDRKLLKVEKSSLKRIEFETPSENYALVKTDDNWLLDGLIPDSTSLTEYLNKITNLNSNAFLNEAALQPGESNYMLKVITTDNAYTIKAYNNGVIDNPQIVMSSSENPGSLFDGSKAELFENAFKPKAYFLSQKSSQSEE